MAKKKKIEKAKKEPRFQKTKELLKNQQTKTVIGLFLCFFSLFLIVAFTSFLFTWKTDQSEYSQFLDKNVEVKNLLGKLGHAISSILVEDGFGVAAYILSVLILFTGIYLVFQLSISKLKKRWTWGLIGMLWFSIFFALITSKGSLLSGVVGYEMNLFLYQFMGNIGISLLLGFVFLSYLAIRFNLTGSHLKTLFNRKETNAAEADSEDLNLDNSLANEDDLNEDIADNNIEVTSDDKQEESQFELNVADLKPTIEHHSIKEEKLVTFEKTDASEDTDLEPVLKTDIQSEKNHEDEVTIDVEKIVEEKTVNENLANKIVDDFGEFDPTLDLSNFKFPSLNLLRDFNESIAVDPEELEANKNKIVDTLSNYKIGIDKIKATVGPTVTLYEIVPEAGVRISKIKNLEDDIALSLSALGIRIIAPIPGKGTIGIEVPNNKATMVSMKSMIASKKFQEAQMELPVAFGKTISNESFVVDLAKMPHLLMAGATGQGKSVGLNTILTSLLYKKHPAELKFVLVDPKKVELTLFNKIERHYLAKLPDSEDAIITDTTKVVNTVNSLCIEMDNRYDLLKDAMVRNIKEYNQKFKARKLNPENGHKFLPYIVLVIDEFADLIMTAGKEIETPIARLAQLARAIGIHLIVATQRPSVNVITGIIKANFPARIAFRVTSKIDSRTILDMGGADQLIGKGDMLYSGGNDLTRIQCAFVDTPEVEKITEFIGGQRAYPEAYMLPEYVGEESGTSLDIDVDDRDALFKDAALVIVNAQQGSASLLQRKLKLGYNRAGRIIDQLEAAGIVGPFEGSKARSVLVPDETSLNKLLDEEN